MKKKISGLFIVLCMLWMFAAMVNGADYGTKYGDYLYYTLNSEKTEATITKCDTNAEGEIIIPKEVYTYEPIIGTPYSEKIPVEVKYIRSSAFSNCKKVTKIDIPETVTEIGNYAFSSCTALSELTIPDSVTKIGGEAFSYCEGLTELTIPDSVTDLGLYAFHGCVNLESLTIGAGLPSDWEFQMNRTSYGYSTSKYKYNLKSLTLRSGKLEEDTYSWDKYQGLYNIDLIIGKNVADLSRLHYIFKESQDAEEPYIKSISTTDDCIHFYANGKAIYSKDKTELLAYLNTNAESKFDILPTTERIGDDVFRGCDNLEKLYLPNGLKEIGEQNFFECPKLTKIVIPDSVEKISDFCFCDCEAIETVYVGKGLKDIGELVFTNEMKYGKGSTPNGALYYIYKNSDMEAYIKQWNSYDDNETEFKYSYIDDTVQPTARFSTQPVLSRGTDGKMTLNVELEEVEFDSQLITVLYKDNIPVSISTSPISSGDMDKEMNFDIESADSAKVFIWDSISGMKPLCQAEILEVE